MGSRAYYGDTHLDSEGRPNAGALVYIYSDSARTTLVNAANLFRDDDDGVDPTATKTNPITVANNGRYDWYEAATVRRYVKITKTGEQDVTFTANVAGPAGLTDHGSLAGLGDDDHTQYVLKAGFSGASVDTNETTASTSYTDLATAGPSVTLTTGTRALVILSCQMQNSDVNAATSMGYSVSGATTVAASDASRILVQEPVANHAFAMSRIFLHTGLNAGSNTFTAKYKVGAGTGSFIYRQLMVVAL